MMLRVCFKILTAFLTLTTVLPPLSLHAETVRVRHKEGLVHGFLVLRTLEGEALADGDLMQTSRGDRVTDRLIFHFKDGSLQEETVVYMERGTFQMISHHLIQKGPAFPHAKDVLTDCRTGEVTVNYADGDGKAKHLSEHLDLPPDLSNGMVTTLLKNVPPGAGGLTLSMIVATPKPRLVKLAISSKGEEDFLVGFTKRKAIHYVVKIEIGGVAGAIAPLVGKQPPDIHVWVLSGDAPAFVRSEGPLFDGGPVWRIELACPGVRDKSAKPTE